MLSRAFEPPISKGIRKFLDLTIHNEIIKFMTLNNVTCIEKEKKNPLCGHTDQMSQKLLPTKRKIFYMYRVGGNAMKISLSHLVCVNCISV